MSPGFGNSAGERSLKRSVAVDLLPQRRGQRIHVAGTSLWGPAEDASGTLYRHMHNQPFDQDDDHNFISICTTVVAAEIKYHTYRAPCNYYTTEELLCTLVDLHADDEDAWESQEMMCEGPQRPFDLPPLLRPL